MDGSKLTVEVIVVVIILYRKKGDAGFALMNGLLLMGILYYLDQQNSTISSAIRNYIGYYAISTVFS